MDFREYEVVREGEELVVVGTIRDPVNWDFTIRLCEDDLVGITKLVLRPAMIWMLLRALWKPRKAHHWSQDHPEHLEEGRQRLQVARKDAVERAEACMQQQAARRPARPLRSVVPDSTAAKAATKA
jgi:hypothetical protein